MVIRGLDAENQLIALNSAQSTNYGFLCRFVFKTFPIFRVRARADNAPAEINASRDESFRVVQSDVPPRPVRRLNLPTGRSPVKCHEK